MRKRQIKTLNLYTPKFSISLYLLVVGISVGKYKRWCIIPYLIYVKKKTDKTSFKIKLKKNEKRRWKCKLYIDYYSCTGAVKTFKITFIYYLGNNQSSYLRIRYVYRYMLKLQFENLLPSHQKRFLKTNKPNQFRKYLNKSSFRLNNSPINLHRIDNLFLNNFIF